MHFFHIMQNQLNSIPDFFVTAFCAVEVLRKVELRFEGDWEWEMLITCVT